MDSVPRLFLPRGSAQADGQNSVNSQTYTCCVRTGVVFPEQAKRVTTAWLSCDSPGYARQRGRVLPEQASGARERGRPPQTLVPPQGMVAPAQLHRHRCSTAGPAELLTCTGRPALLHTHTCGHSHTPPPVHPVRSRTATRLKSSSNLNP